MQLRKYMPGNGVATGASMPTAGNRRNNKTNTFYSNYVVKFAKVRIYYRYWIPRVSTGKCLWGAPLYTTEIQLKWELRIEIGHSLL